MLTDKLWFLTLLFLVTVVTVTALGLTSCTYVDAAGGSTGADGSGTSWQITGYSMLWGREFTFPNGGTVVSKPVMDGLQYLPAPRPQASAP